jgi:ornithine cyclodeaminase/alanine dehydrogenase-like protein (mu-crystallin family)
MILGDADVRRLLRMEDLVPAMEQALVDLSRGSVVQPQRLVLPVAKHEGFFFVMPAYGDALGAKLVTLFPNNEGIPTHHAVIVLFRPDTGEPLVTMDARLITEMRTAAVSAVATRFLARPDASVLCILGSGVQARSHLEALRLVRPLSDVRVWSPHHAHTFADQLGIRAAASAETAVRDADLIVTATTSRVPVLRGHWLAPGAHINAIGAPRPDWRELDDETLHRARLFVESRDSAQREAGDVIAAAEVCAEIGDVIVGRRPGRTSAGDITLFKSVGVAIEDVAAADLVYRKALLQ